MALMMVIAASAAFYGFADARMTAGTGPDNTMGGKGARISTTTARIAPVSRALDFVPRLTYSGCKPPGRYAHLDGQDHSDR